MKRAVLVSGDFRQWGGMDRPNYELAWHLANVEQVEVHLVSYSVAQPLAGHPGVVWHRVPRPMGRHALGAVLLKSAASRVARQIAGKGTRVVSNGGCFDWPDVNWVHAVQAAWNCRHGHLAWPWRMRADWIKRKHCRDERKALKQAELVLTNSHAARKQIVDQIGISADRVQVVYYGIDSDQFSPPSHARRRQNRLQLGWNGSPTAVFIGALGRDRNKGIDVLVESWSELSRAGDWDVRLVVAGTGADLNYWRRRTESADLSEAITFLGFTKQIPEILSAADVLISPTHYDAYGQGVHEALCCGLPAFVTETAGVAERYPDELSLLRLSAPPRCHDIVQRLRDWRGRRGEYAAKVSEFSHSLRQRSWTDMARDIVTLLQST